LGNCFAKLKLTIPSDHKIYKEYKLLDFDHSAVPGKIYDKNQTFKQVRLPKNYFDDIPLGKIIEEFDLTPAVFLIESKHCYNWHRDAWRTYALNLMLNETSEYAVLFAPDFPKDQHVSKMLYVKTEEIRYDSHKLYLLNAQIPHVSLNLGNENRYLLTVAHYSGEPTNAYKRETIHYDDYDYMMKYFEEHNLLEST
jgi:hypothetical protein